MKPQIERGVFMTYEQYRKSEQKLADELPIFFAFCNEQLLEQLKKRGFESLEEGVKHIYRLGGSGGFYLKSDAEKIKEWYNRPNKLPELMKNEKFAVEAFVYEMCNHEYAINYYQGDYDVCSCFCKCEWDDDKTWEEYLREGGYDDTVLGYFKKALSKYNKKSEKWY